MGVFDNLVANCCYNEIDGSGKPGTGSLCVLGGWGGSEGAWDIILQVICII